MMIKYWEEISDENLWKIDTFVLLQVEVRKIGFEEEKTTFKKYRNNVRILGR
jgi:hypothetical protein